MLKVTFLTCAIIATQPLIEGARAGDVVPASLSMVWTGRFVDMARAPVLGGVAPVVEVKRPHRPEGGTDPDIVGSIPPAPVSDAARDIQHLRGAQTLLLCALPSLSSVSTGDDLACGGALHNRWSAKAHSFNYDLSAVKADFANTPSPYGNAWDRQIAPAQ